MIERRCLAILALMTTPGWAAAAELRYQVDGDGISKPLAAEAGDPARGRALVVARDSANCVLCHAVPDPAARFAGDVGPSLAGVGRRFTVPQLRLRVVDEMQVNRATVMPSYYKVAGLANVAAPYAGKPILTAREVEDVVAWLATLQ
jgi:sulfur-oxidizing protein SoxX